MDNKQYAVIPKIIMRDDNISSTQKLLYGDLTLLAHEYGYCWASNKYISELIGVHEKSVSRMIKGLVDSGYITTELQFRVNSNQVKQRRIYIVDLDTLIKEGSNPEVKGGSNKNVKGGSNKNVTYNTKTYNTKTKDTLPKGNGTFVQPTTNPLVNFRNSKTKPKTKKLKYDIMYSMVLAFTENKDLREALNQYLKMRIGKRLEAEQWKTLLAHLKDFGNGNEQVMIDKVKFAYSAGYMTIVPSWEIGKTYSSTQKSNFDTAASNPTKKAVSQMNQQEHAEWESNLCKDDEGNLISF